jgi:tetratricopeptide (TPR) repeat protein
MPARRRFMIFVVVLASSVWLASSSAARPPELDFAKGVVAFSRGNLEQAANHFTAVLEKRPEHGQAVYYLAQARLGLGKVEAAIELFRKAIQLRPENHAIRLDMALALVRLKQFDQAEKELLTVKAPLEGRASMQYYLGFCRYRLERFDQAIGPLQKAKQLDQGFAAAAGYYLGMAHFKLGEQEKAEEQFRQLSGPASSDLRLSTLAQQNLSVLSQQAGSDRQRSWGAYASSGAGYDTNVMVLDSAIGDSKTSAMAFIALGGFYRPLTGKSDRLEIRASLYRSFYFEEGTEGFSLTDLSASLSWDHKFTDKLELGLSYRFDLDMLDGVSDLKMDNFGIYMQAHTAEAGLRIIESAWTATGLNYRFRTALFKNFDERDHFRHEFTARQDFILVKNKLKISIVAGVALEEARSSQWNMWGPLAELEFNYKLIDSLVWRANAGWHREDYYDHDQNRRDNLWAAGSGFEWKVWDHLALGLNYRYLNNASITGYNYDRHMLSVVLMGSI